MSYFVKVFIDKFGPFPRLCAVYCAIEFVKKHGCKHLDYSHSHLQISRLDKSSGCPGVTDVHVLYALGQMGYNCEWANIKILSMDNQCFSWIYLTQLTTPIPDITVVAKRSIQETVIITTRVPLKISLLQHSTLLLNDNKYLFELINQIRFIRFQILKVEIFEPD